MLTFELSEEPWTLDDLKGLGADEHDFQEFKGTGWIYEDGSISPWFGGSLSKQVSAFANAAGGRIFIGLDDEGQVDGGVPVDLKSGGTRSWLEDIVHQLVDPHLGRFNVFEVTGDGTGGIAPGHAVYVIEVPRSEDAPHQARDHRYYLRIAGKSRPMGHIHLEDIQRRTRSPSVSLVRIGPFGRPRYDRADPRGPRVFVAFRAFLQNTGRTLAHHVGAELHLPRPLVGRQVRELCLEEDGVHYTQRPGVITLFRYHPVPVFPGQQIFFQLFWVGIHRANAEMIRSGAAELRWTVYADDAAPAEGRTPFHDYGVVQEALTWLDETDAEGGTPSASG